MANKPLILTDNLFENVVLHPTFNVFNNAADDAPGHEAFRVADNLRDLTWWTPTTTNTGRNLVVDCLAAVTPNTVILDRGHNLKGATIQWYGFTDTTLATGNLIFTAVIPSSPGGLPTDANGCLTPDGVWWKTFTGQSFRVPCLTIAAMGSGIAPIITGLYAGTSYRFTEYLNAPAAYDYSTQVKYLRNELSRGGVRSKSRGINQDRLSLSIHLDSTDYAGFDTEIRRMLRYNVPCWFAFDDSDTTGVGQVRLFQLPGDSTYDPQVNPVHREIRLDLEEVIPTLYI
jgi:hypothetical protein